MEFKTLAAVILLLIGFAVVIFLIFYFKGQTGTSGLKDIVGWNWL